MRPLRTDVTTERLTEGRPEVLRGVDIHTAVLRFEGELPGGVSRQIPLPKNRVSSLAFRNNSSFPITINVRDAGDAVIQTMLVVIDSDILVPLNRLGVVVEFVNPDPSLAQVTALLF